MSTVKVTNLQNASSSSTNITLDTAGNATVAGTMAMASSFLRNRIINGDMRIDQRNAGASVNNQSVGTYNVDRWQSYGPVAAKFTIQQNAGSVTPPAGFKNYLGVTSSAATTLGATDTYMIFQSIEGYNVADLGFGAAGASSFTLSFWVRSSLTGTFGGSFQNIAAGRSYPFTYTINSANTWEQKTITVVGDTSGTWNTTTGVGLTVFFSLGSGTSASGTANTWASANYNSATGAGSIVGTNAATWYLTGVQLESGTVATPFERRLYGQELALCQRYYYKSFSQNIGSATVDAFRGVVSSSGFRASHSLKHAVTMRASPTTVVYNPATGAAGSARNEDSATNVTPTVYSSTIEGISAIDVSGSSAGNCITLSYTASAEL